MRVYVCVRVQGKALRGEKVKTIEQRTEFFGGSSLRGDPDEDSRSAPGAAPSRVLDTSLELRPAL